MKRLITTDITDAARLPIKKGTLEFLQESHREEIFALVLGIIGRANYDHTYMYVLYGCDVTGSYPSYVIGSGAVFYNGEVFQVPATGGVANPTALNFHLTVTNYTTDADPVRFTDNSNKYVHNDRIMILSTDYSDSHYSNAIFINRKKTYTGSVDLGTNHNIIPTITTLTFGTPMPTSSYTVVGQLRTTTGVDPYNKSAHAYVTNKTANGFQLISYGLTNFTMQLDYDYVLIFNEW